MVDGYPFIDTGTGAFKFQGATGNPAILAESDGQIHLVPSIYPVPASSGTQSTGESGWTAIGTFILDPTLYWDGNPQVLRVVSFSAIVETTPSVTMQIRLVNITLDDEITASVLSSSVNYPTEVTADLTVSDTSGNIRNSANTYEVQIKILVPTTPALDDRAICKVSNILIKYSYI